MTHGTEYPVAYWGAGICLATKSVLNRTSPIRWVFGAEKLAQGDTGWRFSSDADTDEDRGDMSSWVMVDINMVIAIEPVIAGLLGYRHVEAAAPGLLGTEAYICDLELVDYGPEGGGKQFLDADTGKQVPEKDLFTIVSR